MSFVSRHPALNRRGQQAERFAELYQQLGMLWEFLALQCRHTEGRRKAREGKLACKRCGTIRPPYGAFLFELPKRALKRFPILVEYDARGKLAGVTIFRPNPPGRRRKTARQAGRVKKTPRAARAIR